MDPLSLSKEPSTESNGNNDQQPQPSLLPMMPRIISSVSSLKLNEASTAGAASSETRDEKLGDNNNDYNNHNHDTIHWIFHFDINETILVGDEVGGDTCEDCFNKMIAKSAFCQMPKLATGDDSKADFLYVYDNTSSVTPTHWWDGTPFTGSDETDIQEAQASLSLSCPPPAQPPPPLYTGWQWPQGCCPYYRTSFKGIAKNFVNHHGAIYKPIYNEIAKRMASANDGHLDEIFHHILPAFFHTVYHLIHNTQNKPPITIVFRTFGTDLPRIAHAMTAFCQGKHPDYPDFIHPEYELDSRRLYNAKWVPIIPIPSNFDDATTNNNVQQDNNNNNKEYFQYQLFRQDTGNMVASRDQQVLDLLHGTATNSNNDNDNTRYYVHGIRDDYPMWKRHNWEPWAGKPVWMTTAGNDSNSDDKHYHHHVLFDDNIHNLPHDGIASVRRRVVMDNECKVDNNVSSTTKTATATTTATSLPLRSESDDYFEPLSGPEIQKMHGLHLIRVPTIEPILNEDWFLQQIDKVKSAAVLHYQTNNADEKATSR